jgi:hypothetical protein
MNSRGRQGRQGRSTYTALVAGQADVLLTYCTNVALFVTRAQLAPRGGADRNPGRRQLTSPLPLTGATRAGAQAADEPALRVDAGDGVDSDIAETRRP